MTGIQAAAGHGGERRDARDDVVVDPRLAQHLDLLATAAEHERVAALQPHDVELAPELDEQPVDLAPASSPSRQMRSASAGASSTSSSETSRS